MKKSSLALSVALASCTRVMAIDLDSPVSAPVTFASETVAPVGGAMTTVSETITGAVGFGITEDTSRFLRWDFPGARLLALPDISLPGQSGSKVVYVGGGIDKDYVIFEVSADTGTSISPTDIATFSFGLASPNLALEGVPVVATFGNYFTAPGALNQNPADRLASSSGALFAFLPGTAAATVLGTTPLEIDFTTSDTLFTGGASRTAIGSFYAAEIPGDQFVLDGVTDITVAASRTAASQLRVSGDFSATANLITGGYIPNSVYLSNDGCVTSILDADSLTAEEAILVLGNTSFGTIGSTPTFSSGPDICMEVNGAAVIPESTYTASYEPESASSFNVPAATFPLGSLKKNSASATSNLVLTPMGLGGVYDNFVRVTNTSNVGGPVFFRLINDLGESGPSVFLADVIGGADSTLAPGASTPDITVEQLYNASIAADPSWSVAGIPFNKLRLITSGDFSSIAVTMITLSRDETLIDTF